MVKLAVVVWRYSPCGQCLLGLKNLPVELEIFLFRSVQARSKNKYWYNTIHYQRLNMSNYNVSSLTDQGNTGLTEAAGLIVTTSIPSTNSCLGSRPAAKQQQNELSILIIKTVY